MKTRKTVYVLVFLVFALSVTISVASIIDYYGKVEGVANVICNPDYKWCEDNRTVNCVNEEIVVGEYPCEFGCADGICLTPTPTPTPGGSGGSGGGGGGGGFTIIQTPTPTPTPGSE